MAESANKFCHWFDQIRAYMFCQLNPSRLLMYNTKTTKKSCLINIITLAIHCKNLKNIDLFFLGVEILKFQILILWILFFFHGSSFLAEYANNVFQIPTINQDTGIAGSEPNETLMKFRSDKVLRPNQKQQRKVRRFDSQLTYQVSTINLEYANDKLKNLVLQIYFGQNLVWKDSLTAGKGNVVKVGDPVFVLRKVSSAAEAAA